MFNQSNISKHRKTNLKCYARTLFSFRCKKLGNVPLNKIFPQKVTNLSSESIELFHWRKPLRFQAYAELIEPVAILWGEWVGHDPQIFAWTPSFFLIFRLS